MARVEFLEKVGLPSRHQHIYDEIEEIITAIRERRAPPGLAPEDAVIVQFTQELLRQHRISDATFKAVQQWLGEAGVVDLLMLIGYYHSLSHTLSALEVMPEAGSVLTN